MSEHVAMVAIDAPTIAQQAEEIADLRRALDVALNELEQTRPTLLAVGRMLGRCDMAFEIMLGLKNAPACHRTARRMRKEIEELKV